MTETVARRSPIEWMRILAAVIAVAALAALILAQVIDVVMRNFSERGGATGAAEWSSVFLAAIVLASLPELVARDVHIRVDFLYGWLPTRFKRAADVISDVCCLAFFGCIAWFAIPWAARSVAIGERAMGLNVVPIYPVKVAFAAIACLLTVMLVIQLIRRLSGKLPVATVITEVADE